MIQDYPTKKTHDNENIITTATTIMMVITFSYCWKGMEIIGQSSWVDPFLGQRRLGGFEAVPHF